MVTTARVLVDIVIHSKTFFLIANARTPMFFQFSLCKASFDKTCIVMIMMRLNKTVFKLKSRVKRVLVVRLRSDVFES